MQPLGPLLASSHRLRVPPNRQNFGNIMKTHRTVMLILCNTPDRLCTLIDVIWRHIAIHRTACPHIKRPLWRHISNTPDSLSTLRSGHYGGTYAIHRTACPPHSAPARPKQLGSCQVLGQDPDRPGGGGDTQRGWTP